MADDASNAESIRNRMEIRGGEWISLELSNIRFLRSSMAGGYYDKPELREWISANGKFNSAHNSIKRLYRPREDDDYLIEDEARPLGKEQCLSAWGGYACEVKIKPVESFEELSFAPPWEVSLQEDFPEYPVAEQHELEKTAYEWRWDTVEFPPVKRGICSSSVEVSDDQDFDLESETKYRPEFLITLFVSENHFAILEKSLLNAETEIQARNFWPLLC